MAVESRITLADLASLVQRTRAALAEGGRPDLAAMCNVLVDEDGDVRLCFQEVVSSGRHSPQVVKALSLDPMFEFDGRGNDG
jgi:hypothetical protein